MTDVPARDILLGDYLDAHGSVPPFLFDADLPPEALARLQARMEYIHGICGCQQGGHGHGHGHGKHGPGHHGHSHGHGHGHHGKHGPPNVPPPPPNHHPFSCPPPFGFGPGFEGCARPPFGPGMMPSGFPFAGFCHPPPGFGSHPDGRHPHGPPHCHRGRKLGKRVSDCSSSDNEESRARHKAFHKVMRHRMMKRFGGGCFFDGLMLDVLETPDAYVVIANLPGWDKRDIEVQLSDQGELLLTGNRDLPDYNNDAAVNVLCSDRRVRSSFRQTFQLATDNFDPQAVDARLEKGELKVTIKKKVQTEVKTYTVDVHSPSDDNDNKAGPSTAREAEDWQEVQEHGTPEAEVAKKLADMDVAK